MKRAIPRKFKRGTTEERDNLIVARSLCSGPSELGGSSVFIDASELRRVIIGIAEDWMKKRFACALYGDALATRPATSTVSDETP